jgi:hypothetical protein
VELHYLLGGAGGYSQRFWSRDEPVRQIVQSIQQIKQAAPKLLLVALSFLKHSLQLPQ